MTPSLDDDYVPSAEAAELFPDNGDHRRSFDAFAATARESVCDVCQSRPASVRFGCVDYCGACAPNWHPAAAS